MWWAALAVSLQPKGKRCCSLVALRRETACYAFGVQIKNRGFTSSRVVATPEREKERERERERREREKRERERVGSSAAPLLGRPVTPPPRASGREVTG